ncbi:Putative uncharacterized protein [Escherichia coli D6-117.29]|nr:Protein of unknown function [Escherichia coli]CDP76533.1 Putative uncharacterized protein [Escherichia coli D6-117.29]CDU39005.1 Protein of unknown function [Escherichia coli]
MQGLQLELSNIN